MYDKIAYGITDEMIKRAYNFTPSNIGVAPSGISITAPGTGSVDAPITLGTSIPVQSQSLTLPDNSTYKTTPNAFRTSPTYTSRRSPGVSTVSQSNVVDYDNQYRNGINSWVNWYHAQPSNIQELVLSGGFNPVAGSPYYAYYDDAVEKIRQDRRSMTHPYGDPTAPLQWGDTQGVGGDAAFNLYQSTHAPTSEGRNDAARAYGNALWNANADRIMYRQAQQREQQRQWQAKRDLQDAQKAIDKYDVGSNMKGKMTPQDWVAMNPLQRGEYINNYNRDQYKQRSEEILNNADVQAAERQRFADNMNRVHGKAWDAHGFTQEQRDAFIDKEFQHSLDKRKQVVGPKTTEGVTQTAQNQQPQSLQPTDLTTAENEQDATVKPASANILSLILPKEVLATEKSNG